jgi:hypothetical protein
MRRRRSRRQTKRARDQSALRPQSIGRLRERELVSSLRTGEEAMNAPTEALDARMAREAGLESSTRQRLTDSPNTPQDDLLVEIIGWCIDRCYSRPW